MGACDKYGDEVNCAPEIVVSLAFHDSYVSLFHLFVHERIYQAMKFCLNKIH